MIEPTPTTPAATAPKQRATAPKQRATAPKQRAAAPQRRASSPAQARALGRGIVNLALAIWVVRDIRHRRDDEINGNRKIWQLAAFAPPVGTVAYFLFGRKRGAPPAEVPLESTEKP